jgi:phosphatidylglycerophosphate synthase
VTQPAPPDRPQRPAELEDWLNARIYHPLSWRLARRLAATAITPNMVSVAGAGTIMLATLAYAQLTWPWGVAAGLALHMSWHVLDGADGDLARLTARSSAHGELVDGICDYAGHIVLYVTMGFLAAGQIGGLGWALMGAAGASRVIQAAHYEGSRRQYQFAVYGTAKGRRHPFVAYYLWLTGWIVPLSAALTAALQDPARRDALREAMRAQGGTWLRGMTLLSANYRTLAVGAAMLAGRPHWYFLFEVVVLGGILALSLGRVRRAFAAALAQAEAPNTLR